MLTLVTDETKWQAGASWRIRHLAPFHSYSSLRDMSKVNMIYYIIIIIMIHNVRSNYRWDVGIGAGAYIEYNIFCFQMGQIITNLI